MHLLLLALPTLGWLFFGSGLHAQPRDSVALTFEVEIPPRPPAGEAIFWMGSLNRWDPGLDGSAPRHPWEWARPMQPDGSRWTITLAAARGDTVRYKYTRGSAFSVERAHDGSPRADRVVIADRARQVRDRVAGWQDIPPPGMASAWPRIALDSASPYSLRQRGASAPRTGGILYASDRIDEIFRGYPRDSRPVRYSMALRDTLLYVKRLSDAPTRNTLSILGGRDTTGRWHYYLDANNDRRYTPAEHLLAAPRAGDSLRKQTATVAYDRRIDDRRRTVTDSVWVTWHRDHPMGGAYRSTRQPGAHTLTVSQRYTLRTGRLAVDDTTVTIGVRHGPTGHGKGFRFWHNVVIDRDGDGRFAVGSGSDERVPFTESFAWNGQSYAVATIDDHGRWLRLRPAMAAPHTEASQPGDAAPAWADTTLSGRPIALEDFAGQYVLLDFWASWCGPCRGELPHLKAARRRFAADRLQLIGVAVDDAEPQVRAFVDRYGVTWPQVLDPNRALSDRYRVWGFPNPVLIGPDGTIVERGDALRGDRLLPTLTTYLP
jgi:peroxiredoxin